jgi:hypothetical protein
MQPFTTPHTIGLDFADLPSTFERFPLRTLQSLCRCQSRLGRMRFLKDNGD